MRELNNKLIAEFMGGIPSSVPNLIHLPQTIGESSILCVKGSEGLPSGTCKIKRINELEYHKSWDWLMPVVSKILTNENYIDITQRENIMDSLPYGFARYNNKGNTIYLTKIEDDTYAAVVEFIKWYNE
jgi:hypothetical protein